MTFDKPERKTSLTPNERLRVAHLHINEGIEQYELSLVFSVNIGRINEAVKIARVAFQGKPE